MGNLGSEPCDRPDRVRCLHSSRCSRSSRPSQRLLLKGLLGKKWKGLARWFKSPIPKDPGLKRGNYYHYNYYLQVIPRCQDSCRTGVFHLQRVRKTDSEGIEVIGLDTATTSSTSVQYTSFKKASFADQARKRPIHGYGISLKFKYRL